MNFFYIACFGPKFITLLIWIVLHEILNIDLCYNIPIYGSINNKTMVFGIHDWPRDI